MNPLVKLASSLRSGIFFLAGKAPLRTIPGGDVVVSPAHGRVIEVRTVENDHIIFEKKGVINHVMIPEVKFPATLVLIEMTPLDVHVQRAPIDGTIIRMDHYRGVHRSAMGHEMLDIVEENEKMVALFQNEREIVGVVQVAGTLARRIRNLLEVGDQSAKGGIYGRIKFGSQVVVIVPGGRTVSVKVGDRVIDGETILAK